jgi:hypothetical protein
MEIRPINLEEDLDEVLSLLSVSLRNIGDKSWFYWKHIQNPFGQSPGYVATEGKKIIGVRLFLKWNFTFEGNLISAIRPVDTATHPDARGLGVFKKLTQHGIAEVNANGSHIIFNTPNQNSLPGYLKMGWRKLPALIPHYFFLINILKTASKITHHPNFNLFSITPAISSVMETQKTHQFYSWRYEHSRYKIVALVNDVHSFLVYQVIVLRDLSVLVVKDFYGDPQVFDVLVSSVAKSLNVFIGHCLEYPTVFSKTRLAQIKRGESVVVYNGPVQYLNFIWKLSPGDLEGIL